VADRIVDAEQSRRLHDDIEGSALHLVPDGGHMPHHINPLLIAAAIDAVEHGRAIGFKQVSIVQALRIRERAHAAWCASGEPTGEFPRHLHDAAEEIRKEEAAYDKALADSFPASDPPANSGITKQ